MLGLAEKIWQQCQVLLSTILTRTTTKKKKKTTSNTTTMDNVDDYNKNYIYNKLVDFDV